MPTCPCSFSDCVAGPTPVVRPRSAWGTSCEFRPSGCQPVPINGAVGRDTLGAGAGLGALRMHEVGSLAPADRHGRPTAHQLAATGAHALPDGPGALTLFDDRQRPLGPPK